MAAKKKNTEGFAFLVDALQKDKNAVYADVKAAAEKKGLTVHPIMFGRAKLKLGYVKAGKGIAKAQAAKAGAGVAKANAAGTAKKDGRGRPVEASSKSGQVRALLSSGMSPQEIAKKVGCTVGLVYNVKSTSGGARAKRGPGRPAKAANPRRALGGHGGGNGLDGILAAVRASQRDLGRYRSALEKIQGVLADVLA